MTRKQFLLVVRLILISIAIAIFLLWLNEEATTSVIKSLSSSFQFVIATVVTLSMGLYVYVDSISKRFPELYERYDHKKIDKSFKSFSRLKSEIISNIVLWLFLLALEKALEAISPHILANSTNSSIVKWTILSLRFSCMSISLIAMVTQIKALNTSNKYQMVLANYEKDKRR